MRIPETIVVNDICMFAGRGAVSAQTRVMIAPTARHAMRINTVIAVLEVCVANHAIWSSKNSVCPV